MKDLKNSIKKILIAHSSNDKYGASKVLISIIDIFLNKGFEVHLLLPNNGPLNENKTIKKTKLSIIKLGVFRKKYLSFFGLINRFYYIIKSSLFIRKYLKKNQIDIVYVNTSTLISPAIASKFNRIRTIYHIHEIPSSNKLYYKFIATFLNKFSKDVICVSKSVYNFWISGGVKKNKARIIYNGFVFEDTIRKRLNNDRLVFTSVSRIIPYKGHTLLIELFHLLSKKNSKIHLQIIGDTLPEYQKYLDNLKLNIKKKGIDDRIKFSGFKNDINLILSNSNFLIHTPILADPFPTVIFEAIQAKTPVITNNLGGAYEILNNGKNGLIIKNNLINDSVDEILTFIENHELQKENSERAFDYVCKNFSLENFEKKIIRIIE